MTKENNLDISIIPFSELAGRIDAEYYKPVFLLGHKLIENKQSRELWRLADVKGGKRLPKDETFSEDGIPYIRAEDVKNNFINYENSPKISSELHQKLKSYQTKFDDVLITIVGNSIGDVGIIKFKIAKCNLTENCAKLVNLKEINADYLFAFLLSKYGQNQIAREKVGTSQPKLALIRIRDFKVPVPNKNLLDKLSVIIQEAKNVQDNSEKEYKEAERFFFKELNLEGYKANDENISIRNFKNCLTVERFDAEYWQSKYDEIEKRVSNIPQKSLNDIVHVKKGVEPGSDAYSDTGKLFIRVSDFSIYGIDEGEKRIPDELYEKLKNTYRPLKGEILFTKDGTIGISFALNEDIDAIVSGAFLRLKPKVKINNDYLALALNSYYCKAQIERMSGGAIIAHLKPDCAMKIKIPLLSDKKQEEIAEKISNALRLRKEAKTLLEKAKRAVEIFIEENENTALRWLQK
ncbi:MAG TPA: hypothetical protein DD723_00230 [Candidatus Omnitrophica bacterium]|nr:MAG: hypothetical protein A2Z81_04525 [Omnitrophica WOR_2 bacterium GWA2_45_18]HBR13962.1 hypothetical protein [Candidatus Omnitrophota bacterium]